MGWPFHLRRTSGVSAFRHEVTVEVDDATRESVLRELRAFNQLVNPVFWARHEDPANEPVPLVVIARDAQGAVAGGLFGKTRFAWFELSLMAVRADLRARGIG